jgi:hypothetical protein
MNGTDDSLMSEQNKALITRWFKEVRGDGNAATIDELFHPQGHAYGFPNPNCSTQKPEGYAFTRANKSPRRRRHRSAEGEPLGALHRRQPRH